MSEQPRKSYQDVARRVLEIEAGAVAGLVDQLDESFDTAIEVMRARKGRIVCTGMGKSGLVMQKVAATLSSTGSPALFLHPAEAIHGDIGMVSEGDVVLAASYSGNTEELLRLTETLKRLGIPLIAITERESSPLAQHADVHLRAAIDKEACPLDLAPTASTTATLALGDALAMALLSANGFTPEDFARLHPGGQLGRRLLKIAQVMHSGDDVPRVSSGTPLPEAIYEMSRKRLGITAVTDAKGRLIGCISDGDLRRWLQQEQDPLGLTAEEVMSRNPRTIDSEELASAALRTMEEHRITSLFVCTPDLQVEGIVHLHDLWGLELF